MLLSRISRDDARKNLVDWIRVFTQCNQPRGLFWFQPLLRERVVPNWEPPWRRRGKVSSPINLRYDTTFSLQVYHSSDFQSKSNYNAHYNGTGPEIWSQTNGRIDAFVAGAGNFFLSYNSWCIADHTHTRDRRDSRWHWALSQIHEQGHIYRRRRSRREWSVQQGSQLCFFFFHSIYLTSGGDR